MKMPKAYGFVMLALAAGMGAYLYLRPTFNENVPVGAPAPRAAPDFELPDSQGGKHKLSSLRGSVVIVHFWASWCPPCLQEIPNWAELSTEFKGENVKLIAVSLDQNWKDALKILPDEKARGIISVLDESGKVPESYGTYQYPETYVLSRDLKIVTKWIGPQDWKNPEILSFIRKLLDSKT